MKQSNNRRTRVFNGGAALVAALLALPAQAAAQERAEPAQEATGREHVVRKGDTLWDLANFYLKDPFLWGVIFEANRGVVEDPHWIYPRERLIIPGLPADAAAVALKESPAAGATAAEPAARTRFYKASPAVTRASGQAAIELEGPEVRVPQVRAGEFYAAPWLSEPSRLQPVGEVVAVAGGQETERIVASAHPYDKVYIRYRRSASPAVGDRLLLVMPGRGVGGWGRVIRPLGTVVVSAVDDDVITAVVGEQFELLEAGALAVPLERFPGAVDAPPQPIADGPRGVLIAFEQEQPLPATFDRAFVSLGREDGLEVGDELVAFLPERRADGVRLPPEQVARLRVVRVLERSATVQVVKLEQSSLRPGLPVQVVAKRP